MLLLHFLDILVLFFLNLEYIFLHFVPYKQLSHLSSNFTEQFLLNTILKTILLGSVLKHMVFSIFLQHKWSMTLMILKTKKPKNKLLKSKSLDHFSDTSTSLIILSTGLTSPPPFYTKRSNKLQMPKFKLFPKRPHFSNSKIPLQLSTFPSSEQHPSLPNYSSTNSHPNDNLTTQHDTLLSTSVTSNTDTPIKNYSRVNYPFPPPSS